MRQDERIGIVGGVGPHAGLDLTRKLFDQTRAEADQEHLPVMLYSFPDRIGERRPSCSARPRTIPARP